jgi:hydrogenase nickel incorporation protein HypA/HybF
MHERAVLQDLVSRIAAIASAEGASRVTRVTLRLGALSHFTPEHFREHFEDATRGTVAEGAAVDASMDGVLTDAYARDVVLESIELELVDGGGRV